MNIYFNLAQAQRYHSLSQRARALTEAWMAEQMFCPHCGCETLDHLANNLPAADFTCPQCHAIYELKSSKHAVGRKIVNGAYDTLIERITSLRNPDLFVLTYHPQAWCVEELWLIPRNFFVPAIVEQRPPLSARARRAGWVGSYILFSQIPEQGRICLLRNRKPEHREEILRRMRQADALATETLPKRRWLLDVLTCVNQMPARAFTLAELARFEPWLTARHPNNQHILPKLRQQLQVLRDRGLLAFLGRGRYQRLGPPPTAEGRPSRA